MENKIIAKKTIKFDIKNEPVKNEHEMLNPTLPPNQPQGTCKTVCVRCDNKSTTCNLPLGHLGQHSCGKHTWGEPDTSSKCKNCKDCMKKCGECCCDAMGNYIGNASCRCLCRGIIDCVGSCCK